MPHRGLATLNGIIYGWDPQYFRDRASQADRRTGLVGARLQGTRLSRMTRDTVPLGHVLKPYDDKNADRYKVKRYPKMDINFLLLQKSESERLS